MKTTLKPWKKISSKRAYKNPYMVIDEHRVILPNGKRSSYYVSNQDRDAVCIITCDKKNRFLIQKEYRYPTGKVLYEFPGGLLNKREAPLRGAKREFQEETGYCARTWEKLGSFYASPSRTNLRFFIYLAKDLAFIGDSPDEAEFLEHEWVSEQKLRNMVKNGTLSIQTELAALFLYYFTK